MEAKSCRLKMFVLNILRSKFFESKILQNTLGETRAGRGFKRRPKKKI